MQVTVFGASGKVGRLVVSELLERGHDVVAFVHSHNPLRAAEHLTIVQGDIANQSDVEKALQGSQAAINCLGSWGRPGRNVMIVGMGTIIPAMTAQNIRRIISLTGHGADAPYAVSSLPHKLMMKLLSPFPAGKVFYDGEEHMRMLAASTLDWTVLRSAVMRRGGSNAYHLSEKPGFPLKVVSRSAVVAAIVDQLESNEYLHQAPVINPGR